MEQFDLSFVIRLAVFLIFQWRTAF